MATRTGTNGADNLTSPATEANILYGLAGNDTLVGGNLNDFLDGGTGIDSMSGGLGNDTYVVDDINDRVTEVSNPASIDTVRVAFPYVATYSLPAYVENTQILGSQHASLIGNGLANVLTGNSGNNVLDGGAGADSMSGGAGDDTYVVDNTGDRVNESASAGIDLVRASVNYTLPANVENLVLTGSGMINGTGNDLQNELTGNAARNILNGGGGADLMAGGAGDDVYVVDNSSDQVIELPGNGKDLVVALDSYMLPANVENLTLTGHAGSGTGNDLNNVIKGNDLGNLLSGGGGDDELFGNGGSNILDGGQGNDIYHSNVTATGFLEDTIVDAGGYDTLFLDPIGTPSASTTISIPDGIERLYLNGSAGINLKGSGLNDSLFGNAGDNIIDGGMGADFMYGGKGNDTFIVDNAGDRISDPLVSGWGIDTVKASVDYDLTGRGAVSVENLTLTGAAGFGGGNQLNNIITGNAWDNDLYGYGGNDSLLGGDGDDALIGGYGADVLTGGTGNDVFVFHVDPSGLIDRITDFEIGRDHFSIAGDWSYQNHADAAATIRFVQSGTSAVLQMDADLTGPDVTWVGIATFDNQSAASLNAQEGSLFY